MAHVLQDLLDLAAMTLVEGGRLVYWLPVSDEQRIADLHAALPAHRCLELVAVSEQVLTLSFQRHLVTMRKARAWEPGDAAHVPAVHGVELKVHGAGSESELRQVGHHGDATSCSVQTKLVGRV
jgi:tRNA (guanine10-N2)-methyltransferase